MLKNDEIAAIIMLIREKVSNDAELISLLSQIYDLSRENIPPTNTSKFDVLSQKFEEIARCLAFIFKQYSKKNVIKEEEQFFKAIIGILEKDF